MSGPEDNPEYWIENVRSPGALISYLYRTDQTFLARGLRPYGIGGGQFPYLMRLYCEGEANQDTLARSRGYDKTTTTRALKKLEDAGYIVRQRDPGDGRARIVQASEEGERIRPAIEELSTGWAEILFASFSESEKKTALELLRRMALNVSSYMETEEEGRGKPSSEIHPHESPI